ncbi:MAG: VanZ family protein [Blastocatellia bacterium]|nr:VanZ family protein [Blastocatellia bacterium]MCS7156486.1 VanZ family protein [Blastocatellia bacterium]MCX7751773.1 VanZ family protein [Blastocatellia bacterium]MDW8168875.1 VanZ family protein [Acidobacteriota bacterium]MDW8256635.1 VanZ family protein [Acidobacteriota bacterium]
MSRRPGGISSNGSAIAADERTSCARKPAPRHRASPSSPKRSVLRIFTVRWLPALLWTGVVLGFSSEAFAATQTSRLLLPLLRWMFPSADPETLDALHLGIRKLAHVIEYAILAALFVRAWSGRLGVESAGDVGHALLPVAVVAAVDEYRQSLSTLRTGSLRDWGIDLGGALLAMVVLWIWGRRTTCGGRRGWN